MSKLSQRTSRRSSQGAARPFEGRRQVNPPAAGVDSGAHEIMACVPAGDTPQLVRAFGTSTADLDAVAAGFVDRGLLTVAMESPGVYWMPLFEPLAARGLPCGLSSAQAITPVPGRQSDVLDWHWMQTVHSYGLCKASFRPAADLGALRPRLRPRAQLMQPRAPHGLQMPKALLPRHRQLSPAHSDVPGAPGQRLLRANGAALRNDRC
jgi:hypothetical protein